MRSLSHPVQAGNTTESNHKRAFTDNVNNNNKLYRESETMLRVGHDQRHLRENVGLSGVIYHEIHHPMCYCEEYQQKVYNCE